MTIPTGTTGRSPSKNNLSLFGGSKKKKEELDAFSKKAKEVNERRKAEREAKAAANKKKMDKITSNISEKKSSVNKRASGAKTSGAKKFNVGVSKGGVPFKEAFKHFRDKGNKTFTWNGKQYTTELASAKKTPSAKTSGTKSTTQKKKVGGLRKFLLGEDGKFGGARGAIDFLPGKSRPKRKAGGGMMKRKGMAKGGAMKKKGYKKGGMPMKTVNGMRVPAFAADGEGPNDLMKKRGGGSVKKKGMSKGGVMKKKGMAKGGSMKKKGMAKGGAMTKKGMAKGGAMKKKGYAKGGMTKKGYAKGGMTKKGYAKGGAAMRSKMSAKGGKKGGVRRGKPRGVGAALRGFGKALR